MSTVTSVFQTGRITGHVVQTAECPDAVWNGVVENPSTTRCAFCPIPSPYWPVSTNLEVSGIGDSSLLSIAKITIGLRHIISSLITHLRFLILNHEIYLGISI